MYAVGREHPLQQPARDFFEASVTGGDRLATSTEVLQEMMHAYLPLSRMATLDAALSFSRTIAEIWPIEEGDVVHARALCERHKALGARDLLHIACCQRRGVTEIKTFDRGLASAFG